MNVADSLILYPISKIVVQGPSLGAESKQTTDPWSEFQ